MSQLVNKPCNICDTGVKFVNKDCMTTIEFPKSSLFQIWREVRSFVPVAIHQAGLP